MYLYLNRKAVDKISGRIRREALVRQCLRDLKAHHPETYYHSIRVCRLSIDLAIENKLPLKVVKTIGRAGMLHDYGKYKIDRNVLSKCGGLDEAELALMSEHPRLGMIALERFISKQAGEIIACHHNFKCTFKKDPIQVCNPTLINQIVAAADMYDALCCPRAYKEAFGAEKVKGIMEKEFSGEQSLIDQLVKRPLNPELSFQTLQLGSR